MNHNYISVLFISKSIQTNFHCICKQSVQILSIRSSEIDRQSYVQASLKQKRAGYPFRQNVERTPKIFG